VYGTIAARFNDDGVTALYQALVARLTQEGLKLAQDVVPAKAGTQVGSHTGKLPLVTTRFSTGQNAVVPPARVRYLAEIAETVRGYHGWAKEQAKIARERQQLQATRGMLLSDSSSPRTRGSNLESSEPQQMDSRLRGNDGEIGRIDALIDDREKRLAPRARKLLDMWPQTKAAYTGDEYVVKIRGKEIRSALTTVSLSGTHVPKVALPKYEDDGEILRW